MTLTTSNRSARSELVAQKVKARNLCGMVTRTPSTFEQTARPASTAARSPSATCIGTHMPS